MNISELLKNKLETLKVIPPQTLFDVEKVEGHCPWCFNRLKLTLNGKLAYCNSKKHRRQYKLFL